VYTLGQRHGFTLHTHTPERVPHYVVEKDIDRNTITVSTTTPTLAPHDTITLRNIVWRGSEAPVVGKTLDAQFRYRQKPFTITITSVTADTLTIEAVATIERGAKGQSCVLYEGDLCIGGGIIA
jgi:tRNA-specific 2-thiouridylase